MHRALESQHSRGGIHYNYLQLAILFHHLQGIRRVAAPSARGQQVAAQFTHAAHHSVSGDLKASHTTVKGGCRFRGSGDPLLGKLKSRLVFGIHTG